MALIDGTVDASLNYIAVRANDAEEMLTKLTALLPSLEGSIIDIDLKGCGAGPKFMACLTIADGSEGNSPVVTGLNAAFIVVGGSGGIDPIALAAQLAAEVRAVGSTDLYKVLMACGGAGPNWMGLAMYQD